MNHAQHKAQAMKFQKSVWLYGTAGDVFYKGMAVAYNRDYGTATDREGERDKRVERVSTTNHLDFAGVLDQTVTIPTTGSIKVIINEPGSVCDVALGSDTTVNATYLSFVVGCGDAAGRFRSDDNVGVGRGTVKALQTNASGNIGESIDGTAVVSSTTVTKTGLFASAAAGDYVVIMASSTAAGAAGATPGIYTISSVTSDDVAVLSAAPGDGDIACYVISGNPTAMCELLIGEPVGGIEWIECLDNAASQSMVGGTTHLLGGVTLGTGDCTSTLADGTFTGLKKGFVLHGALTTQDYLLTVTSGLQMDGTTGLATAEFDADGDYAFLTWRKDEWQLDQIGGPTLA